MRSLQVQKLFVHEREVKWIFQTYLKMNQIGKK